MATEVTPRVNMLIGEVKSFVDSDSGSPSYRMTCTASSDEVDLGVDRFTVSALKEMERDFPGMTVFMNHKYIVPEDVFGVVTSANIVRRDGHNDLDLEILVDEYNPRAMSLFNQASQGIRLGISVGVLVKDATTTKEDVNGRTEKVLNINSVTTLEVSVVGIPANRRSWVSGAMKAAGYGLLEDEQRDLLMKLVDPESSSIGGAEVALEDEEKEEITDEVDASSDVEDTEDAAEPVTEVVESEDEEDEGSTDDSEEEEGDEPEASSDEPEPDGSEFNVTPRAQVVAALRKAVSNADRDWFTIKEAETVESEDGEDTKAVDILIYDAIGDGIGSKDFVDAVASIEADRINVRINSPGGVITDGIAMRNALLRHGAEIHTYVDGLAASMGSILAMCGKTVTMEPDSMLMIHEPWGCAMGEAKDMEREARILNKYGNQLAGVYARKAGGDRDEWRDIMREEGWYTPEEAVDVGLADKVGDGTYSDEKVKSAQFDIGIFSLFKNAPESAKRFFTASTVPDKAADASELLELTRGVVELTGTVKAVNSDNESLRARVKSLEEEIAKKDAEAEETNTVFADVMTQVNKLLDMAQPRKTAPEAQFLEYAEKYPWLDARITAQLARDKTKTT